MGVALSRGPLEYAQSPPSTHHWETSEEGGQGAVSSMTTSGMSSKEKEPEVISLDGDSDDSSPAGKKRCKSSTEGSRAATPSTVNLSESAQGAAIEIDDDDEDDEVEVVDMARKAIAVPCELCNREEGVRGLGCCYHAICLPCLKIHVEAQAKLAQPVALCPVPKCTSPVLSAMDLLFVRGVQHYDAYSRRQLETFKRIMLQVTNDEATCPRCDGLCPESTTCFVNIFKRGSSGKRKRGSPSSSSSGSSPTSSTSNSKDLAAQMSAPPKILNCPGCSLRFCPMCAPLLGPDSINYFNVARGGQRCGGGKGIKASINNQRLVNSHGSHCPRIQVFRLYLMSEYTRDMLSEFRSRERIGAKKSSSASSSAAGRSFWIKGTGFGGSTSSAKATAALAKAEQDALKRQQNWDLRFQDVLQRWRTYIPSPNAPITPEVQGILAGGFLRSGPISTPLCLLLRLLLRNDSFLDLSSRRQLYITALDLLTDLSSHILIAHMLTRPVEELKEADELNEKQDDRADKAKKAGSSSSGSNSGTSSGTSSTATSVSAGTSSSSTSSVDPLSLLGMLDKLKMAASYFQKCGGKAQSTVTAEEEAGFLQDMALSIKISETHETIVKRLNEHTMRWERELPSQEATNDTSSSSASSSGTSSMNNSTPRKNSGPMMPKSREQPSRTSPRQPTLAAGQVAAAAADGRGSSSSGIGSTSGSSSRTEMSTSEGKKRASSSTTSAAAAKDSGDKKKKEEEESGRYAEVMGPLKFEAVPLLEMVDAKEAAYTYQQEAKGQDGVVGSAQKRLVRVMHEITSLATSLPVEYGAGIFVRVDEERPDVLKALISGPVDTPYANGLFEFDVWLPGDYPNCPPKVQLITTGGGRCRFNPNMYNSGKVCLSLLGTWSGPGWDPKRSTLLQVLLSIQSLILVSDPYFNEPGYEGQMSSPQGQAASQAYNAGVRHGTLRFAILEQMKKPSAVLKDVVDKHFALKRDVILRQCQEWVNEAPLNVAGSGNSTGMSGNRAEVDKAAKEIVAFLKTTK